MSSGWDLLGLFSREDDDDSSADTTKAKKPRVLKFGLPATCLILKNSKANPNEAPVDDGDAKPWIVPSHGDCIGADDALKCPKGLKSGPKQLEEREILAPVQKFLLNDKEDGPGSSLALKTLLLCDWDDTILPTSWLEQEGLSLENPTASTEQLLLLEELAARAREFIKSAQMIGRVTFVTNARKGWVETSCAQFLPSLASLLEEVEIVSARSICEILHPDDPWEWKRVAFAYEVNLFNETSMDHQQLNVISLGDSDQELEALVSSTCELSQCWGKAVKLLDSPSVEQLIQQHDRLGACFSDIVNHSGSFATDIRTLVATREQREEYCLGCCLGR